MVLFLVMDVEWNMYDQRAMEYATERLFSQQRSLCHVIRRTPQQMQQAELKDNKALVM